MAMALAFGASGAGMVTWFHAWRLLGIAAGRAFCQRRRSRWLLVVLAATAAGVMISTLVLGCMSLGAEMSLDRDRPMTCTTDELGGCRPTVDRSGPATPQAVHAIYVAAAIALVGLSVLLVCRRLRAPTLTRGVGDVLSAEGGTPDTTLLDHNSRNAPHG